VEYLKDGINDLATDNKNKSIRCLYKGIHESKRGYQPRRDSVNRGNPDLYADSHNNVNRWKNYFSQLLNEHVSEGRQTEMHTAEPLVPGPNRPEVETAIAELKKRRSSPGSDQIPVGLIQAGGETLLSAIHKFINSIWNKEWKGPTVLRIYKKGACSNNHVISLPSTSYRIFSNILLSGLCPYIGSSIGDRRCGFRCIRTTNPTFCSGQVLEKIIGVQ
jgi:hypothetical protein